MRIVALDVETTGISTAKGDRIVEIGLVEIKDNVPTGEFFHQLIHPDRDIPADATRIHGIDDAKVADAPRFCDIAASAIDFIGGCKILAHNAPFDIGFFNAELAIAGREPLSLPEGFIDTLLLAREKFPGQRNSLDQICQRLNISLEARGLHGALIDARLAAEVYLELSGARSLFLRFAEPSRDADSSLHNFRATNGAGYGERPGPLRANEEERAAHAALLEKLIHPIWLK